MIRIDMEMPSCCYRCKMLKIEAGTYTCCLTSAHPHDTELRMERPTWCPLKEATNITASENGIAIGAINGGLVIQKGQNNKHIMNNGTMTMTFGK